MTAWAGYLEKRMQRSKLRMTPSEWIAGCLVFVVTILCGVASTNWSVRAFSRPASTSAAKAPHTRTCITVDGKRFEWNFPNPPFGTQSCSE